MIHRPGRGDLRIVERIKRADYVEYLVEPVTPKVLDTHRRPTMIERLRAKLGL